MATRTHDLEVETLAGGGNGDFAPPVDEAVFEVPARPTFVETPFVRSITDCALAYMEEGFPVHLRAPTGCGKATLAIHLAERVLTLRREELTPDIAATVESKVARPRSALRGGSVVRIQITTQELKAALPTPFLDTAERPADAEASVGAPGLRSEPLER